MLNVLDGIPSVWQNPECIAAPYRLQVAMQQEIAEAWLAVKIGVASIASQITESLHARMSAMHYVVYLLMCR